MEPLSIWCDHWLQKVVHLCPAYLVDSWHFLNEAKTVKNLTNHSLVTFDATGMYANINTDHAIECIAKWFELHKDDIPPNFPVKLVLDSIHRLMKYNVFHFGNRFFIQKNGTSMGTNVGCMYATIYYSYHEETVILKLSFIKFYKRLIDDAFIIIEKSNVNFQCLKAAMNNYGPPEKRLEWKPEQQGSKVHFLDLWISIPDNKATLEFSTYQKPVNMYLYRCPFSAQPESTLFGLIYSTLHRYFWQNTHLCDFRRLTELFFNRLLDRAHTRKSLIPLFLKASNKIATSKMPNPKPSQNKLTKNTDGLLFVHLPFHPQNPPQHLLKRLTNELLSKIQLVDKNIIKRIIISLSRAPNIGNICKRNRLEFSVDTTFKG